MTTFIVVTDASKGIGRAAADALVDDGMRVASAHGTRSPLGGNVFCRYWARQS
jgi:NAD(P)-dependent dehydrogenase (short-subunit alcohol dehydrogenase family)